MINPKNLIERLESLGLSKKEAQVYLTLLELNEAQPSIIARRAEIKRPTAYLTLESLEKRGLASRVKKQSTLYFRATRPEVFIENEKNRLKQLNASLEILNKSLPELLALHSQYVATPRMAVYYGKEGIIQIMEDSLTAKTEILCWSNVEIAESTFLTNYHPSYIKKKIARKIHSKCLFDKGTYAKYLKKQSEKQLREVRFIPDSECKFENEINIYDDKVSIISLLDEIGIIIQNKAIADSQRALFEMAFKKADLS